MLQPSEVDIQIEVAVVKNRLDHIDESIHGIRDQIEEVEARVMRLERTTYMLLGGLISPTGMATDTGDLALKIFFYSLETRSTLLNTYPKMAPRKRPPEECSGVLRVTKNPNKNNDLRLKYWQEKSRVTHCFYCERQVFSACYQLPKTCIMIIIQV